MNEEHAEVDIRSFADATEAAHEAKACPPILVASRRKSRPILVRAPDVLSNVSGNVSEPTTRVPSNV